MVFKKQFNANNFCLQEWCMHKTVCTWLMASCFRFWFLVILRSPLLTRSRPAAECSPLWYVSMQYFSRDSNRLNGTHSSSLRLTANAQALLYDSARCRPDRWNVMNGHIDCSNVAANSCCEYCGIKLKCTFSPTLNSILHDKALCASGHRWGRTRRILQDILTSRMNQRCDKVQIRIRQCSNFERCNRFEIRLMS